MMDDSDSLPQDHRPYDEGGRLPLMRGRTKVSELSTYWATFWSVVAIILSVLLLVAYGAIMRYIKVSQSLDRLERSVGLLSKGQGVGGVCRFGDGRKPVRNGTDQPGDDRPGRSGASSAAGAWRIVSSDHEGPGVWVGVRRSRSRGATGYRGASRCAVA
ncbi:MAG: hypothetical protein EB020_11475 [Proteobacteria bacterium]|nr:hypothetical protein [Pseudomonadota bacterium]